MYFLNSFSKSIFFLEAEEVNSNKILIICSLEKLSYLSVFTNSKFISEDFPLVLNAKNGRIWMVSKNPLNRPCYKSGADVILAWCFSKMTYEKALESGEYERSRDNKGKL